MNNVFFDNLIFTKDLSFNLFLNFNTFDKKELFLVSFLFFLFFYFILFFIKNKKLIMKTNYIYINSFLIINLFYFIFTFNYFSILNLYCNIFFILFILLYHNYLKKYCNYEEFILYYLILFSTILLISNNNIITIILLLEIQTFCILILNINNNQNILKSEASLKYFIISSITSGFFLIGFSILYYITGSINLNEILLYISFINNNSLIYLYILAIFFIIISLLIKLGLFPFQNWLIDIYNGFNYPLIFFTFILQKPILFYLFYKIINLIFFSNIIFLKFYLINIILFITIMSILIGSIGILIQSNIKKFLAYSSLVTNSYLLLLILNDIYFFDIYFFLFIFFYNINNFLLFFFFKNLKNFKKKKIINLIEIYNYIHINKYYAFFFILILFSFLGLPPFSGFFQKYLILYLLDINNILNIILIVLILNLLSSFYYLRIIKFLTINEKFFYVINSTQNMKIKFQNFYDNSIFNLFIILFFLSFIFFLKIDFFLFYQYTTIL